MKDQEIATNILKQGKKKFTASQTIQTETEPTRVDTTSAEVNCSTVSHPDDEHMKVLTNKLLTQVSKIVDEKLATFWKQLKVIENIPCKVNEKCKSTFSEVLKKNIPKVNNDENNIKVLVKEALIERERYENNLEERKTNIIVFNAPESTSNTLNERRSHDTSLFLETCNSICDGGIPSSEILQVRRLGPLREEYTRPLFVKVKSESTKRKIFSKLYKLRATDSHINMSHDMAIKERKKNKDLVEEVKRKIEELTTKNNSKNWAFKVRDPPWDQQIMKVRVHPQI